MKGNDAADARAVETSVAGDQSDGIFTDEDFIRARTQQEEPPTEEIEPEGEELESPPEAEEEIESEEPEQEQDPLDELELSEEERAELEANPKGRLAKRINQLVRQRQEANERAIRAEQALAAQQTGNEDPLEAKDEGPNPFDGIEDQQELVSKARELDKFIEWAENLSDDNFGEHPDAEVYEEDGQAYTLKQIRTRLRQARKDRNVHLRARYDALKRVESMKAEQAHFENLAKQQLAWVDDESSVAGKEYQAALGSKDFAEIKEAVPHLAPRLQYLLAHAFNSLSQNGEPQRGKTPAKPQNQQRKTPPASPVSNAAAPSSKSPSMAKQLDELNRRAVTEGSEDAFLQARALAHQNQ